MIYSYYIRVYYLQLSFQRIYNVDNNDYETEMNY